MSVSLETLCAFYASGRDQGYWAIAPNLRMTHAGWIGRSVTSDWSKTSFGHVCRAWRGVVAIITRLKAAVFRRFRTGPAIHSACDWLAQERSMSRMVPGQTHAHRIKLAYGVPD